MDFLKGIQLVEEMLAAPLPGISGQLLMAPAGRPQTADLLKIYPDHKVSSVLMLLYPDNNGMMSTLFIERAHDGSNHSGQIAFPGGKSDPDDLSIVHTALRELEEETGIPVNSVKIAGSLTPLFIPVSKFMVHPHIGLTDYLPELTPQPGEVHSFIKEPIHNLLAYPVQSGKFETSYGNINAPYFDIQGHRLWGATAMIVSEFREAMRRVTIGNLR